MPMPIPALPVRGARLLEIRQHLTDKRHFLRGDNGFEVPTWVLPISPTEVENIINELIARRSHAN